jgi:hypothetical protein
MAFMQTATNKSDLPRDFAPLPSDQMIAGQAGVPAIPASSSEQHPASDRTAAALILRSASHTNIGAAPPIAQPHQ